MTLPVLMLNHLNLPARDPERQRKWYAEKLGFEERGPFLWSGGTLLVFVDGVPVGSETLHFGFRVDSLAVLRGWVDRLRANGVAVGPIEGDESYSTVYVEDPEQNRFEMFYEP